MSGDLTREQQLYDKFVDALLEKLDSGEIAPKELEIVMKFLDNQNIQASTKHKGLAELAERTALPFDTELDDELPLKRIK